MLAELARTQERLRVAETSAAVSSATGTTDRDTLRSLRDSLNESHRRTDELRAEVDSQTRAAETVSATLSQEDSGL